MNLFLSLVSFPLTDADDCISSCLGIEVQPLDLHIIEEPVNTGYNLIDILQTALTRGVSILGIIICIIVTICIYRKNKGKRKYRLRIVLWDSIILIITFLAWLLVSYLF